MHSSPKGHPATRAPERSDSRLLPTVERGRLITIYLNDSPIEAHDGETVATALLAAGCRVFRLTQRNEKPRGLYCGMGLCYECLVSIDDGQAMRACLTPVREGMRVWTPEGFQ